MTLRRDWQGEVPWPVKFGSHPEWFTQEGDAKRLAGPRYSHDGDKFWHWGPTEWVREIGPYTILKFLQDRSTFSNISDQVDHGVEAYAVWVDGVDINHIWLTLDEALVDAVRFKHEGPRGSSGPRATEYFLRMIGATNG